MKIFSFRNWQAALGSSSLSDAEKQSYEITINWYLGYLKRTEELATLDSARAFMAHIVEERKPNEWVAQRWRAALNWFFKEAPVKREAPVKQPEPAVAEDSADSDGATETGEPSPSGADASVVFDN